MPNWAESMQQSYDYYTVDPVTLADVKRLDNVRTASFSRDSSVETLGSATIEATDTFGEAYVRGYLNTVQNGVAEKHPLGTVLVQTPSSRFDGILTNVSMDAYTPLIELKEKRPPLGYTLRKGTPIMKAACDIVRDNARAPVSMIETSDEPMTLQRDFVADPSDTWLSYLIDLIKNAKYELGLDANGYILFQPIQNIETLQPVWTYDDGNSSILYNEITMSHDLYGIPNVVEVVYSYGGDYKTARAENNDPDSPVSIPSRGRIILKRDTEPPLSGYVTQNQIDEYAKTLLKALSTVEYSISYTHGYCPVRVGDCVRLDYERAGLTGIKAKVVSQNITCDLPCRVSEQAVFTHKLWEG